MRRSDMDRAEFPERLTLRLHSPADLSRLVYPCLKNRARVMTPPHHEANDRRRRPGEESQLVNRGVIQRPGEICPLHAPNGPRSYRLSVGAHFIKLIFGVHLLI